jgi:hypothetical protein
MVSFLTEGQLIMKRFPPCRVSYETMLHKNQKSKNKYDVCLAIPFGKKYYIWFTFYEDQDICLLIDVETQTHIRRLDVPHVPQTWAYGTILYGAISPKLGAFFIEDIYWYQGLAMDRLSWSIKLGYIYDLLSHSFHITSTQKMTLPYHMSVSGGATMPTLPYDVHHVQYRSLNEFCPFVNEKPCVQVTRKKQTIDKQIYNETCIFAVTAMPTFDVYHLHAYRDANHPREFAGVAGVPSLQKSVFLNQLFRNIRENQNIDAIEESDDETEFENEQTHKHTYLEKILLMECYFDKRLGKWIPEKVVSSKSKLVPIYLL